MADLRAGIEALIGDATIYHLVNGTSSQPEPARFVRVSDLRALLAAHPVQDEGAARAYFGEGYEFALIHLDDEPVQADLARLRPRHPLQVTTAEELARPEVVVLCGSTRFRGEMVLVNRDLTLAGCIVLAPGVFGHSGDVMTDAQKVALDALHHRKIDLADRVFVVNVGGYIGQSTRDEIEYARRTGKPIEYIEATS